jgi:3-oxoacyl-[acyl-carrier protein] reductase
MAQVALVTGGGRGIGLGISKSLAGDGWNIVFCGVRDASQVSETIKEIEALGVEVLYCQADISQGDQRQKMLVDIKNKFGALNLLVNNAGVAPNERADILEAGEESFDRLISINLKGPYFLTQLMANWMLEQKKADDNFEGSIVNISSVSSFVASVNRGDYCLSKAAVSMGTKLWATRLAEFDIPVYEIQPGIIQTDMTSGVTEKYDKFIADGGTLQKRWGKPSDIGKATAALARGDLPYATGQVLILDGGLTLPRL